MSKAPDPRTEEAAVKALAPSLVVTTHDTGAGRYAEYRHPDKPIQFRSVWRRDPAEPSGWTVIDTSHRSPRVLEAVVVTQADAEVAFDRADWAANRREAARQILRAEAERAAAAQAIALTSEFVAGR